jgi:broad specificity phosphatase PhoE
MVAGHLGLPVTHHGDLGENDRSSTGYLPPTAFEATADRFFAEPDKSASGWARAIDEQTRIVAAIRRIVTASSFDGTMLIIAHGAVGALLMADLLNEPISRRLDQPGGGGGNWFAFRADTWRLLHQWRVMDTG